MDTWQPLIKWTGSKRSQASQIASYMPRKIKVYYEPFCGGLSMGYFLLKNRWAIEDYFISDICPDLITLWKYVQTSPKELIQSYKENWTKLSKDTEHYYEVRDRFNKYRDPQDFLFLSRTCINGLIRFNKNHEFNSSLHLKRQGILPATMGEIILEWNKLLQKVNFHCGDYREIDPTIDDWCYLDPPYSDSDNIYSGNIDFQAFLDWIGTLKSGFALSFNAKNKNLQYENDIIPSQYYNEKILLNSGVSTYRRLVLEKEVQIFEYLYLNYKKDRPPASKPKRIIDFY